MSWLSLLASWSSRLGWKFLSGVQNVWCQRHGLFIKARIWMLATGVQVSPLTEGHPMSPSGLSVDSNVLAACSCFFMAVTYENNVVTDCMTYMERKHPWQTAWFSFLVMPFFGCCVCTTCRKACGDSLNGKKNSLQ